MRACNCARASPFQSRTCEGCDGKSNCGKTALRWFQSTHPRGVRPLLLMIRSSDTSFNPRTRVGCDCFLRIQTTYMLVSIHAPAWGATVAKTSILVGEMAFQSTHPRGVRRSAGWSKYPTRQFQSTHPRGVRRLRGSFLVVFSQVSIHAPAWGATSGENMASSTSSEFQSTHPRGVRQGHPDRPRRAARVSIHAPAWGATS